MNEASTKDWYDRHYATGPRTMTAWYAGMLEMLDARRPSGPLVELGCGSGILLERLAERGTYDVSELYGIDQSTTAVEHARRAIPNVAVANIEGALPYADDWAGTVVLAEVIEHLVDPVPVLREIRRVLRPDGVLLLSFPNYLNVPWLCVRVAAELADRPAWIVLQPIDRIYTVPVIRRRLATAGLRVRRIVGNTYWGPKVHEWEPRWFRNACNAAGLSSLSFHPVLECIAC